MKTIKASAMSRLSIAVEEKASEGISGDDVLKIIGELLRVKKWTRIPYFTELFMSPLNFVVNKVTAEKVVDKLNSAFPNAKFKLYAVKINKATIREADYFTGGIVGFCIGDFEQGGPRINIDIDDTIVRVVWNDKELNPSLEK